jgi:endonuclease YncB( thermonuclease family)
MTAVAKGLIYCLAGFFAHTACAVTLAGVICAVHDGDTVTLQLGIDIKKIRLAGIDAPELKQPYGIESRDALRQDVLNQQVTVLTIKSDKYGRSVGKVLLEGEDVNLKQVSRGLAWVYTDYIKELAAEDRELYRAAESAANDAHIGLWQDDQPVAPWTYRKTK